MLYDIGPCFRVTFDDRETFAHIAQILKTMIGPIFFVLGMYSYKLTPHKSYINVVGTNIHAIPKVYNIIS